MMARTTRVETAKSPVPLVKAIKSFGPMNATTTLLKTMPRIKPTMRPEVT